MAILWVRTMCVHARFFGSTRMFRLNRSATNPMQPLQWRCYTVFSDLRNQLAPKSIWHLTPANCQTKLDEPPNNHSVNMFGIWTAGCPVIFTHSPDLCSRIAGNLQFLRWYHLNHPQNTLQCLCHVFVGIPIEKRSYSCNYFDSKF